MKVVSLNVGGPKEYSWMEKTIQTSIFKEPVLNKRRVSFLNIEGDQQSDLRVHGGVNKAIYAYDLSYYEHWKGILQRQDWQYGMFGENLTTSGLPDDEARIGNIYQAGTVHLQVIQPRFPCYKLNIRFGTPDMLERFSEQKRNGIYFRVVREGSVQAGDEIRLLELSPFTVTVQDYVNCYFSKGGNWLVLETILYSPFLSERDRAVFENYFRAS
jgi:MOSC domain-containing protein YiiM